MSNIEGNLAYILSARYGKDVRLAIHDAIHDCYEDGKAGAVDLIARERIDNLVANNNPTEGNSELLDIRVGADGKTYGSAGEAVRANFQYLGHIDGASDTPIVTDLNDLYGKVGYYWITVANTKNNISHAPDIFGDGRRYLGILKCYSYNPIGYTTTFMVQEMLVDNDASTSSRKIAVAFRISKDKGNWSEWEIIANKKNMFQYLGYIDGASDTPIVTDLNDLYGKVGYYWIMVANTKNNISHAPDIFGDGRRYLGILKCYSYNPTGYTSTFMVQEMWVDNDASTSSRKIAVAFRISKDKGNWSEWEIIANKKKDFNEYYMSAAIFEEVCVIGDSYTSGHIDLPDDPAVASNPSYSWPHYMEKITGNTYYNCGISGVTVLSWLSNPNGLQKARTLGVVQAYIIGLGLNDRYVVPLGSYSDIGTENQTYYGGLSKIVEEIHEISPKAKIFIQTMTKAGGRTASPEYNQAIKDVVDFYKETYPIHVLDLDAYKELYDTKTINNDYVGGHQTAIGYRAFAQNLCYIMSDYINNHISDFQDVYEIPTE